LRRTCPFDANSAQHTAKRVEWTNGLERTIRVEDSRQRTRTRGGHRQRVEDTAEALGVALQTAFADWKLARAWLAVELGNSPRP
jgi:hypothetical protein